MRRISLAMDEEKPSLEEAPSSSKKTPPPQEASLPQHDPNQVASIRVKPNASTFHIQDEVFILPSTMKTTTAARSKSPNQRENNVFANPNVALESLVQKSTCLSSIENGGAVIVGDKMDPKSQQPSPLLQPATAIVTQDPLAASAVNEEKTINEGSPVEAPKQRPEVELQWNDPFVIDLSENEKFFCEHPKLVEVIDCHLGRMLKRDRKSARVPNEEELMNVIHQLWIEFKPSIVERYTEDGAEKVRSIESQEVYSGGSHFPKMCEKLRQGFATILQAKTVHENVAPVAKPTATGKPVIDLVCDEEIEPFADPLERSDADLALLGYSPADKLKLLNAKLQEEEMQQQRQKLRLIHIQQQRQRLCIPKGTGTKRSKKKGKKKATMAEIEKALVIPFAEPRECMEHLERSVHASQRKLNAMDARLSRPIPAQQLIREPPKTPDRQWVQIQKNLDATPVITNTTNTNNSTGSKRTGSIGDAGIVAHNNHHSIDEPALPKKTGPTVVVNALSYDWSSLNLDGTAAWNKLLRESMLDNPGLHKSRPQKRAVDTYQLMLNLKDSLHMIPPPPDSQLHSSLRQSKRTTTKKDDSDPTKSPEKRKTALHPSLATVYNNMVDYQRDGQCSLSLQRNYQYMNAQELVEHMNLVKQDVEALAIEEQRILGDTKTFGCCGKRKRSKEDCPGSDKSKRVLFWDEDLGKLLKRDTYLKSHDQY